MTVFGWDASNYDDPPRQRDGIDLYTHKAGEGHHNYYDREYKASLDAARELGIPVLGAYFVNHPGTVADQVDWFVGILDEDTPWWRTHPCFILQIDAEKFDYMPREPSLAEIQAFGDRLVQVHGVDPRRVLAYAPQWLYGNRLTGLTYRLWASAYGPNPAVHYRQAYPGDGDGKRWQAYSGQTPLLLQYGSATTIGDQTTCDANAFRGTLDELLTTLGASTASSTVEVDMFRVLDPENEQFVVQFTAFGWAWEWLDGNRRAVMDAAGVPIVRDTRPGIFGNENGYTDVRKRFIDELAAKVVASLPPSSGGTAGPTLAQIEQVVDKQLDQAFGGGADND